MSVETKRMISVIVPVYNINAYIEKCIVSLLAQTYRNLEIILVDDGSTDGSGQICDKYAKQDDRIVVLHKENGGLSDARNYGIERAHGCLLAFVDGDDWVHPQMYEMMVGVMETWQADVVTCWFEQADKSFANRQYLQNELHVKLLTGAEAIADIEKPLVVAWNKLYKKEIFAVIKYPKGKLHEDEYVIHRIFYQCKRVAVIGEPLYFYSIRDGSIVAQMTPARLENALEALADRVEFADSIGWSEVMPAVVKRYCDYCIDRYRDIKSGRYDLIDMVYLDRLWRLERSMIQRYPRVEISEEYKCFAEAPERYDRWLVDVKRKEKYCGLIRAGLKKTAEVLRIKR